MLASVKYTVIPMSLFLIGAIFAGLVNFSYNQQPSPKNILAAATPTKTPTPTPTPTKTPTPTPTPIFSISGVVFIDTNGNGTRGALDSNYTTGATISAVLNGILQQSIISLNTGKYSFTNLLPGTYTITFTAPSGYRITTPNPLMETITNANIQNEKFGIIPTNWNIPASEKFVMCHDLRQFVKDHCE